MHHSIVFVIFFHNMVGSSIAIIFDHFSLLYIYLVCLNQIRLVFEGHGTIVEVVLLRDKRTGERQGIDFAILCIFTISASVLFS